MPSLRRRKGASATNTKASSTGNSLASSLKIKKGEDLKGPLGLTLLHSPSQTRVDFVFVHGLGGDSRKTWTKGGDLANYWPQQWLPQHPKFDCARIHAFGYESNWRVAKENCWNIHHFGQSLLTEMYISPTLCEGKTPIVFVGHSMGGLVIKKAILLAKDNPNYDDLADRFQSIYFLATPHRGSDYAKIVSKLIQIRYAPRAYVAELARNSNAIRAINDAFQESCINLKIWSFYETRKLRKGVWKTMIVDFDSATLGYSEEIRIPVDADHRNICKFATEADPNFVIIRDAIMVSIGDVLRLGRTSDE